MKFKIINKEIKEIKEIEQVLEFKLGVSSSGNACLYYKKPNGRFEELLWIDTNGTLMRMYQNYSEVEFLKSVGIQIKNKVIKLDEIKLDDRDEGDRDESD